MDTSEITINWGSGVFAVPDKAAEALMLADITALRFILFVSANKRFPAAAELRTDDEALEDAVNFWLELGVLQKAAHTAEKPAEKKTKKADPPEFRTITPAHIAESLNSFPEVRRIFSEVENIKGKPLNHTDQQTLLWIHEYLGMPAVAVIMLYGFAVSQGKKSMSYIAKVASDWASREITDPDSIEAEILSMQKKRGEQEQLKTLLAQQGLGSNTADKTAKWQRMGVGKELLAYVLDYAKRKNKFTIEYIDKTLSNLISSGVKTAEEAAERERSFNENARRPAPNGGNAEQSSYEYDADALMEQAIARMISFGDRSAAGIMDE